METQNILSVSQLSYGHRECSENAYSDSLNS